MTYTIYGIRLLCNREVRYVGQTRRTIRERLEGHISAAKSMTMPTAFASWLLENGSAVEIFQIGTAPDLDSARAREREAIELCLAVEQRLFNRWLVPAKHRIPARSLDAPITGILQLLKALGGQTVVAVKLGVSLSTVNSWSRARSVPHWRIQPLVDLAEREGFSVSPCVLASDQQAPALHMKAAA